MVALEKEHKNLKRKLVAIKNGTDAPPPPHPSEDLAKAIQLSQENYDKHLKKEEKRFSTYNKQMELEKQKIDEEIIKAMELIEKKEEENFKLQERVRDLKKIYKDNEEKKKQEEEKKIRLEEEKKKEKEREELKKKKELEKLEKNSAKFDTSSE